ncbi:MAG: DoxX family protein [Bernardetiaceae bacterium]|jgi:uncharacterized membrane protein YphA (DoxX/SURF4 family)|nr:DoxX family protein [Bernardetiaceae bacterium]
MAFLNRLLAVLVGGLFVFSGLIKINDPVGTQIKMEEYFQVFAQDFGTIFERFTPFALPIAVAMCVLEVVLGVALLVGYRPKFTLWSLLGLIVFFTFLTFYSAFYNKVTDCGCFGDAIKLTPWQSFYKDVALLVLIGALWWQRNQLNWRSGWAGATFTGLALVGSLGVAYWAIAHLPFIDFRVYKVGNHIPTLQKPAEPCQYLYVMKKDGKKVELTEYPQDPGYEFDTMLVQNAERCTPRIVDYRLWNDTTSDFAPASLTGNKLIITVNNVAKADRASFARINQLLAQVKNVEVVTFTSSDGKAFEVFRHEVQLATPYYFADGKMLKTIMRSDPGIFLLQNGTVKGKWHYNDVPTAAEVAEALR